jgi:hypothetical protein
MEGERKTMTRTEIPLTIGEYKVDGISIIVLQNKIIVDTGEWKTKVLKSEKGHGVTGGYPVKKKNGSKEKEDRGILAGATDFALHGLPKKKGGRLF